MHDRGAYEVIKMHYGMLPLFENEIRKFLSLLSSYTVIPRLR